MGRAQHRACRRVVTRWSSRPTPSPTSSSVGGSTSGREAEEGRSVFSAPGGGTEVGESLSPLPFDLRSDPVRARSRVHAVSCHTASRARTCRSSTTGSRSVERLDLGRSPRARCSTTAPRPRARAWSPPLLDNLTLELPGATSDLDDLVAGTERGLLLTCLWYIREVDPATLVADGSDQRRGLPRGARRDRRARSTTSASTRARSTCSPRP